MYRDIKTSGNNVRRGDVSCGDKTYGAVMYGDGQYHPLGPFLQVLQALNVCIHDCYWSGQTWPQHLPLEVVMVDLLAEQSKLCVYCTHD
jgi:hypothetical protein